MSEEKLTRMRADTFRAKLRLGLGFSGPVHVPEKLKIRDTAIEALCHTLCVDGDLDLSGCTNLRELPTRLIVRGKLTIDGCSLLSAIPATVREVFGLSASGCERLASIATIVECRGELDLTGCNNLAPLSADFRAKREVKLSGCTFLHNNVLVPLGMPETAMLSIPGRPLGAVVSHRLLHDHSILNETISSAYRSDWQNGIVLQLDCSSLVEPEDPVR